MKSKPHISVIGPGRVGLAMGLLAAAGGYPVVAIASRRLAGARKAASRIGPPARAMSVHEAAAAGDIVLLTVPDAAIERLCRQIARKGSFKRGSIVAHCSGALGSEALRAAADVCGCRVASLHPLQTFPTADAAIRRIKGTYFFLEGDRQACAALSAMVKAIGGKPLMLGTVASAKAGKPAKSSSAGAAQSAAAAKALYHAAGCIASNYLIALLDAAIAAMCRAGISPAMARQALEPLVAATLANVWAMGCEKALTGPISRGDIPTIQRHLWALGPFNKLQSLYRSLGTWTVDLAARKKTINSQQVRQLRSALAAKVSRNQSKGKPTECPPRS